MRRPRRFQAVPVQRLVLAMGLGLAIVPTIGAATGLASVAPPSKKTSDSPALSTTVAQLDAVQVTATRTPMPVATVPSSITVIEGERLSRPGLGVNLSEKLVGVPGVLARERQNYAQDLQISVRGFGARSTFGIRGVRLYLDGIPATMPDGQGQVSNFNLASAGRIEILRGPFSALYGNASGGVIQVFTADGTDQPGPRLSLTSGSDGTRRESLGLRGAQALIEYTLDATRFVTDGFRDHSAASRESFNAKLKLSIARNGTLSLLANALRSPEALDPLGLSAVQLADDPRQAIAAARLFNTRKSLDHGQLGAVLEQALTDRQTVRLLAYAGSRQVLQFLAVPVVAQGNALNGGGVVDLDSHFHGFDGRWTSHGRLGAGPLQLVLGVDTDRLEQHRLGFNNFSGTKLGIRGALRRDQDDSVENLGWYAQASWAATPRTLLMLGLRHSRVRFESSDHYITAGNPDDSGRREFSATTPVAGASITVAPGVNIYASYGFGFETPTFDELGYQPDGNAGLNFALEPARSHNIELGLKARLAGQTLLQLALFRADTVDELAVATNAGGRSTYQNVGHARRQGFELSVETRLGRRLRSQLAYTLLDARFRDDFLACNSSPCATPTVLVPAGSLVPGLPRSLLALSLDWDPSNAWHVQAQGQRVDSMAVNNAGDARTHPYAVVDAGADYRFAIAHASARGFLRVSNIFNRHYAGSVIVNESNGRYFEPAPGRTLMAGLDLRW